MKELLKKIIHTISLILGGLLSFCLLLFFILSIRLAIAPIDLSAIINRAKIMDKWDYSSASLVWPSRSWSPQIQMNDIKRKNQTDIKVHIDSISILLDFRLLFLFKSPLSDVLIHKADIKIAKDMPSNASGFSKLMGQSIAFEESKPLNLPEDQLNEAHRILNLFQNIVLNEAHIHLEDSQSGNSYDFPPIFSRLYADNENIFFLSQFFIEDDQSEDLIQLSSAIDLHKREFRTQLDIEKVKAKNINRYIPFSEFSETVLSGEFDITADYSIGFDEIQDIQKLDTRILWKLRGRDIDISPSRFEIKSSNQELHNFHIKEIEGRGYFDLKKQFLGIQFFNLKRESYSPIFLPGMSASFPIKSAQSSGYIDLKNSVIYFPLVSIHAKEGLVQIAYKAILGKDKEEEREEHVFSIEFPEIGFQRLLQVWPREIEPDTYDWIEQNIQDGKFRGIFTVHSRYLGADKWSGDLNGHLYARNVSLRYMETAPLIFADSGQIIMQGDNISIEVERGKTLDLDLENAKVALLDLSDPDQAHLSTDILLDYSLQEILGYVDSLYEEGEGLFVDSPYSQDNFSGHVTGRLGLNMKLNLESDLQIEDLNLDSYGKIEQLKIENVLNDRPITLEKAFFQIDQKDIQLIPKEKDLIYEGQNFSFKDVTLHMAGSDFLWSGQFSSQLPIDWVSDILGDQLSQTINDVSAKGSVGVVFDILAPTEPDRPLSVKGDIALKNLDFSIPSLDFEKELGEPARLKLQMDQQGKNLYFPLVQLSADDLMIKGNSAIIDDRLEAFYIDNIYRKKTDLSGVFRQENQMDILELSGSLDLSGDDRQNQQNTGVAPGDKDNQNSRSRPIRIDLKLKELWLNWAYLTDIRGWIIFRNQHVQQANLIGKIKGSGLIHVTVEPEGTLRHLRIVSSDGGSIIQGLQINESIIGGDLNVVASFDVNKEDLSMQGQATLSRFRIKKCSGFEPFIWDFIFIPG